MGRLQLVTYRHWFQYRHLEGLRELTDHSTKWTNRLLESLL